MKNSYILKKIALTIMLIVIANIGKGQIIPNSSDTIITPTYDTMIRFYHPEFANCNTFSNLPSDSNFVLPAVVNSWHHGIYFNYYNTTVHPPVYDSAAGAWRESFHIEMGLLLSKNEYFPEGFAQPYHFDSPVTICGISAHVGGVIPEDAPVYYFRILDSKFATIAKTQVLPAYDSTRIFTWQHVVRENYWLDTAVQEANFYIAADESTEIDTVGGLHSTTFTVHVPNLWYYSTNSVFDTIWRDTTYGCQASESPWLLKNGEWKKFADDSVYQFSQKCFLDFIPILKINNGAINGGSGIKDIDLEKTCSVYPNPTEDRLKVESDFKVRSYGIYDMQGKEVKRENINMFEFVLNVKQLPTGRYVLQLETKQGRIFKNIIKK
ncbi:MAG: T9SS type A sorting domain-containing protein [Bacteroidales bacterium]|jgi:hypothetical protein|nr:T9SS type A sorting domain-containing protein [Bacteroidales bacterium]